MSVRCALTLSASALLLASVAGCAAPAGGTDAAARRARLQPLRRTAAAEVFDQCRDSVVNIGFARKDTADPKVTHTEFGSGVVIHEAGYVLASAHLLRRGGTGRAGFHKGREYPVRVVAVDERRDLAVLKLVADGPFRPVPFGHSRDLLVGEQIVTLGSPFGMGLTVTCGIVSALGRATKSDFTFFPDMIQTAASNNPGMSGGPVLNVFGEMVGLNATWRSGANDIGFAIPVDRIREALPEILEPEGRLGFVVGIRVADDGPARVVEVAKDSPAAAAGVRPGDLVTGVGKAAVASGLDFHFALMECKAGQAATVRLVRDGGPLEVTVTPAKVEPRPADAVSGLAAGLGVEYYAGTWDRVPDFATLQPASSGKAAAFDLAPYKGKDHFALRFTGYVEVPADGVYAFFTLSDDGSRLWIGDRLVVDNDGPHPAAEKRGFIPLKAGKHAVTVGYFERIENEELTVSWEGPTVKKQPIPASALFMRP